MKHVISVKDIPILQGKFIVQLNAEHDEPDYTETFRKNSGFWLEKRISFVSQISTFDIKKISGQYPEKSMISLSGFYYSHGVYTEEEFVEFFNNYLPSSKGERYHRLLTPKELAWLFEEIKTLKM